MLGRGQLVGAFHPGRREGPGEEHVAAALDGEDVARAVAEEIELVLRVDFDASSAVDLAVLNGVHLATKFADTDSGVIGEAAGKAVVVAAGTTIERALEVTLPVAVQKGAQAVWVRVVQVDGAMAWASPVTVVV